jgi:hypothetical protein
MKINIINNLNLSNPFKTHVNMTNTCSSNCVSTASDTIELTKSKQGVSKKEIDFSNIFKNRRINELKKLGLDDEFVEKFAELDFKSYKKVLTLSKLGVFEDIIEDIINFDDKQYKKAIDLINNSISDENLYEIIDLDEDDYKKALDYSKKGLESKSIISFIDLSEEDLQKAEMFMKQGYPSTIACYLAQLNEEQQKLMLHFIDLNMGIENAFHIAQKDSETQKKYIDFNSKGISSEDLKPVIKVNETNNKRLEELLKFKVEDSVTINKFCNLSDKNYKKAINMLKNGVIAGYITHILDKENENDSQYFQLREKGYSRTSAYVTTLFSDDEQKELENLSKIHPEINNLYKDEYDITLIRLQSSEKLEAIFSKEAITENGTKITITKTFDEAGNKSSSRTEEYKDHSTSSIIENGSGVFRVKYNKQGDIEELTHILQNRVNKDVIGVFQSKTSPLLKGAYNTTYYDVSDFKTDVTSSSLKNIENSVKNSGIALSNTTIDFDGTVNYIENWRSNGCDINRLYKEKKNDNNEIEYSYYSFKIKDETGKFILNTEREYKKKDNNVVFNKINGVNYKLTYDDDKRIIKITDGTNTKTLKFKNKLSYYFSDTQWQILKTLHADTLIAMDKNIKKWNYCENSDSIADNYIKILSTGNEQSILAHEIGHFIDYSKDNISRNEELQKIYLEEMNKFSQEFPFNEQTNIMYLSPRADLQDANGLQEFFADVNLLLTNYGVERNFPKSRSQFLARYFPKSLTKAAQLLDKTSTKSLLE